MTKTSRALILLVTLSACSSAAPSAGDAGPERDAAIADAAIADAALPDAVLPDTRVRKVLLIGLDGVRHDSLAHVEIPAMRALAERGVWSRTWLYALPMSETVSGPGWSTNLTGVWPDKHRVFGNDLGGNDLGSYPDFSTRIERVRPELHTYAIADWAPITASDSGGPVISAEVDERVTLPGNDADQWAAADQQLAAQAAAHLAAPDADVTFVYFGSPDMVAHKKGAGPDYLVSIEKADQHIAQLVAAVEARPSYADESWLYIVTTDHGHRDAGGHGGATWQERQSWVLAAGGALPHMTLPLQPRNVDIVPTILAHLEIPVDPSWGLDGMPLATASTECFDGLHDALLPAQDETSIPAAIRGWTHATPAGWSIDNTYMPTGGVSEWRGWSFVDEAFWSAAQDSQGREAFVRSRGVIAVADSDEWDDLGSPSSHGRFDSTLVSSPFPVSGGSTVVLSFASLYRQEGEQKGQVLVAFGDGADQVVLHYGPEHDDANDGDDVLSRVERVTIPVPAGESSMVVRWRLYDAGNDWFWAIDDARVQAP